MSGFSSSFRSAMVDCEIYRHGIKVATYKGLINDSKDYNCISFDCKTDIQIGDDIYCPLKNKHYIITTTDIKLFSGKPHRLDAYFENNFSKPMANAIFNTYNPSYSIIGTQQNVSLNITDSFNNLQKQISEFGNEDQEKLQELLNVLKSETTSNEIHKSAFSKFNDLITKHGSWLIPSISQIIVAWIQRG